MSTILEIKKNEFGTPQTFENYEGYEIITDTQTIKLGISKDQNCCENWGYLMSEDNFDNFIGADVISITQVDTALNSRVLDETSDLYEGAAMFVNILTTKGLLQFVAYNSHNGYYSHEAVVISREWNLSENL